MVKGILRLWPAVLCAALALSWRVETVSSEPSVAIDGEGPTAILLGSREGPDGEAVFREWSKAIDDALKHPGVELPGVWVLCFEDSSTEALARQLPHVMPFVVDPGSSWASVLRDFKLQVRRSVRWIVSRYCTGLCSRVNTHTLHAAPCQ